MSEEMTSDLADFAPFIMDGLVSLPGNGPKVPVKMLRDTAQSFILEGVLPFSNDSAVGSDIPVLGFGMKDIGVPLHKILEESDLVSGEVAMGVRPGFLIKGVSFLMGNDLARGKVLVTPEVTPIPVRQSPDELAEKFPRVFAACAVTQSWYKQDKAEVYLSDSFICYPDDNSPFSQEAAECKDVSLCTHVFEIKHLSLNCDQLIVAQKNYATISPFFEVAVAGDEVKSVSTGYFVGDGLLMPKWTPLCSLAADDWSVVTQL